MIHYEDAQKIWINAYHVQPCRTKVRVIRTWSTSESSIVCFGRKVEAMKYRSVFSITGVGFDKIKTNGGEQRSFYPFFALEVVKPE